MSKLKVQGYNPDVLSCIASLSNDEVFTPPDIVNAILDTLPKELFENPKTTFLDPACKSGVFLREIAKRLIKGLENKIPNLEKRIDHILHNQLFGIAITELTSLLSRRSLYCSKFADGKYSVSFFKNPQGNIRFKHTLHTWKKGKCVFCGASQAEYGEESRSGLESHAYEFIHTLSPENIFNMKFDVVIGNPPYQMGFGLKGGNKSNAKSIYNLFISAAIKLRPQYICMITPSRWMTRTAQGIPDKWISEMLSSNHFEVIHDFENAKECFPKGVEGGVSYFLWNRNYYGKCKYYFHKAQDKNITERFDYLDSKKAGIIIRNPQAYSIIEKIERIEDLYHAIPENNFSNLVSPKHFFDNSVFLTSNWHDYKHIESNEYNIKYYLNLNNKRTYKWIKDEQIPKNIQSKNLHKVCIPAANGGHEVVLGKPFYSEPNSVCSQTFLVIGYDINRHNLTKQECLNIITYIQTKFFRYLVSIKKKTQNGPRGVYQFVPMQDFSKPWTDEELYKKYNLTDEEIAFIESMIKPMNIEEANEEES